MQRAGVGETKILKNYRLTEKRAGGHRWKEKKIGTRQQLSVINFLKGTEVYLYSWVCEKLHFFPLFLKNLL